MRFNIRNPNYILGFAGVVFVVLVIQMTLQTGFSWSIDFEKARLLGLTLSGFLSFLSIWLLYVTVTNQTTSFRINQIENKFFDQIKFHRSNVESMIYKTPRFANENEKGENRIPILEKGSRVFVEIYEELRLAVASLIPIVNEFKGDLYKEPYKNELKKSLKVELDDDGFKFLAVVEICYLALFFGMTKEGLLSWNSLLQPKYNELLVNEARQKLTSYVAAYDRFPKKYGKKDLTLKQRVEEGYHIKYFGGHQNRLGHYFRNLFQTVNYINEQTIIDYPSKYGYVKTLRAQLTTYEQVLLFYNSLTCIGRAWELEAIKESSSSDNEWINKSLITKYSLVKNIPVDFYASFPFRSFYPDLHLESESKSESRRELEKKYT